MLMRFCTLLAFTDWLCIGSGFAGLSGLGCEFWHYRFTASSRRRYLCAWDMRLVRGLLILIANICHHSFSVFCRLRNRCAWDGRVNTMSIVLF